MELMAALKKRNISCSFADNRNEALEQVMSRIPKNSTVGIGGSITIKELNIKKVLKEKGCKIYWHWYKKDIEDSMLIRHKAMIADTYLCSTNAITMDGRLVNIDGTGNRVASMVFGPKSVLIVIGINKITKNIEAAMKRVKEHACPLNARRLNLKIPCALTGRCNDCESPNRMCNVTTIIEGKPNGVQMHIIIIDENMGF